ncbi:hypothetical protein HBA54_27690 [Pelagibius litoralis]|uniref:Large polyvalent protein associated domain-containing protein n=1 Tax=Pelagibius litoralis TaxID=374515 RepID=A0A967KIK2_9PROT|nr:hypothetical protein [Pelagibius litoralis]NIA72376.1 hypothetical protein [Pelagibius litoralis]
MSAADCIAEIKKAAGRDLADEQLDDLVTTLRSRQKQRRLAQQGESAEEAILKAADEMADDLLSEKLIAKRNEALNFKRRAEVRDYVEANFAQRPALGLEARITGVNAPRGASRLSATQEQHQLTGYYTQGFLADVEKEGLWQVFVSGALDREIAREMWEIRPNGNRGISGSDEAARMAEVMHKWQEATRIDANRAGASVKKSPGYVVRQSHDTFKIRNASFEDWRDFILPKLDAERTFAGVDDVEKFLTNVYEGLASGVHLANAGDAAPSGFKGFANLAQSMSQDRVLHFRAADDWFDYNGRFGNGSLRESLIFGFERMARQTGLMRVWGPNPAANYDSVFNELLAKQNVKGKQTLRNDRAWLDNRFAEVDGSVNIPGNVMLAKWSAMTRAVQSMAKLGGATLSAFADIPIAASELRYQGVGFLEAYGAALKGPLTGRGSAEQRQILGMLGVMMDSMKGNAVHRFSGHDDLPGAMSRMMRTFFKWNGLTWWTDSMRSSVALAMSHRLAMVKGTGWGKLDPDLKRTLGLFGIGEGDWPILQKATSKTADGQQFLVPEGVREVDDATIRQVIGADASDNAVRRYREGLEGRLRSYFTDRVDYAVITPDARTNAILKRGTQPGTVEGEAFRFITQFKSFPVAVLTRAVGREVYGRGADSLGQALRNGNGEMLGLANLMLSSAVFGYLAMSAKDLAKGRAPRDPNSAKTWAAALVQGGGFGIYGDFLFGEVRNRFGGSALSTALGPTAGTVDDLFDIWGRVREGDDALAKSVTTLISNTPFANLFYTRAALDYLFLYQMREAMNPGFLRRMEKRIEKENAQTFLLRPSSAIPTGGGNRPLEGIR